jgi:hypothetical protein
MVAAPQAAWFKFCAKSVLMIDNSPSTPLSVTFSSAGVP